MKSKKNARKKTRPAHGQQPETSVPPDALWAWLLTAAVALAVVFVRWRLLAFPLERDEGEYAYSGQLLLQGIAPYKEACNMKLPGTAIAYAGLMQLFGQTIGGIHLGLLLVNLCTIWLVYILARQFIRQTGAATAAAFYGCTTLSQSVLGLAGHATHFVVLFALGGCLFLLRGCEKGRARDCFGSGLFFGIAFLMKQPGLLFGIFGGACLLYAQFRPERSPWRLAVGRCAGYCIGLALPFALVCAWMLSAGVFDRFWFWTFSYAKTYGSTVSLADAWQMFLAAGWPIFLSAPGLWFLAAAGLVIFAVVKRPEFHRVFIAGFCIFSFLAICPGFFFRQHYFILLLPAAALLAGLAVDCAANWIASKKWPPSSRLLPLVLAALACGQSFWAARAINFQLSPVAACRATYGANPFPESLEIARYIAANSEPRARIAVIGSEPQIYFYANRRSATSQIYTYALMEPQPFALQMQQDMIREIEQSRPQYLVFVSVPTSWLARPDSHRDIMQWTERYQQQYYRVVGLVQFTGPEQVESVWGEEAALTPLRSQYFVAVFRLKDAP